MYAVLVYDISGEGNGKKILPKVFKVCKKYLTHIQNSVFEGDITKSQLVELNAELNKLIRKELDSVIIFKSRHVRWLEKEFWGKKDDAMSNFF